MAKNGNSLPSHAEGNSDVLLAFPGKYGVADPQVPLSLLYLASPLQREGYSVRLFDMRLDDYRKLKIGNPVFVGISTMSGLQIRHGLDFARKVRETDPSIPIVWGGVHPTLLPEQTIANSLVDIVVRGEGESMIVELAKKLEQNQSLNDVNGITYKPQGKMRHNPDGELLDLDSIPVDLPYDLLKMNAYPSLKAGRFHIQTSRGCPHACGFCYNTVFNKRKWRAKSAKRVLDEIEYVKEKFPNVNCIDPIDDNFFVDKQRVADICRGMTERRLGVAWRANCRFDYMASYDRDFIGLLEKSGCVEIDFGAESGSSRLLEYMEKGVTAGMMMKSVENLKNYAPNIEPYVSWMSGLPGETYEDLKVTFDLMDKMREINPKTQHFGVFVFTPFPSPILGKIKPDFTPPQSLEEWSNIDVFHFHPLWHSKKYVQKLHAISAVTRYAFYPEARIRERNQAYRLGYGLINRMAKYRWRHRYFGMPLELNIVNAIARRFRGFV